MDLVLPRGGAARALFRARHRHAHQWLLALDQSHGVTFQPSELGKLAAICTLAAWFAASERVEKEFLRGFVSPLRAAGILMA